MRLLHAAFTLFVAVAMMVVWVPTSAQTGPPIYLKRLGRYPVVGSVQSTARLRASRRQLLAAAKKLPLTPGEYDALNAELVDPKVLQYGEIPEHLQAMTSGPAPYHVIHNVHLLTKQYGWHLTYSHGEQRSDIYIPNACGNVSLNRSKVRPWKSTPRPPLPSPNHPAPVASQPLPPPTTAPSPIAPTATPGPNKKFFARYWPEIGALLIACATQVRIGSFRLCSFGNHGSQSSPAPRPSVSQQPGPPPHSPTPHPTSSPHPPTPTPVPTLSPTPLPTMTPHPTPTISPTPYPTKTPYPTPTPHPTCTPKPTPTPHPTCTPHPTPTPKPTHSPCPPNGWCHTPSPSPSESPTPKPTHSPCPPTGWCHTPSPSPMPSWEPARTTRDRSQWSKIVQMTVKAWGVFSQPRNWKDLYFSWGF